MLRYLELNLFTPLTFYPLFQRVPRTGWVYRNVKQPESVSDHMYRMAMMALTLQDPSVNRERYVSTHFHGGQYRACSKALTILNKKLIHRLKQNIGLAEALQRHYRKTSNVFSLLFQMREAGFSS